MLGLGDGIAVAWNDWIWYLVLTIVRYYAMHYAGVTFFTLNIFTYDMNYIFE